MLRSGTLYRMVQAYNGRGFGLAAPHSSTPDTHSPTLLHQGHTEKGFIKELAKHGTTVDRPTVLGFKHDGKDNAYPVEVTLRDLDTNIVQV